MFILKDYKFTTFSVENMILLHDNQKLLQQYK